MRLTFRPAEEADIRAFSAWRYEPPYDVYNEDTEDSSTLVRYFLDPQVHCTAVTDESGELVAYCTFGPDGQVPGGDYGDPALDIGLGVRPDLTGQGRGSSYVSAVIEFARATFAPRALRVTVAAFNRRALRVWERAGFQRVQTFERQRDGMPFVVLQTSPDL
jgi:RimJ/RimL family protein N-acetyltransferase